MLGAVVKRQQCTAASTTPLQDKLSRGCLKCRRSRRLHPQVLRPIRQRCSPTPSCMAPGRLSGPPTWPACLANARLATTSRRHISCASSNDRDGELDRGVLAGDLQEASSSGRGMDMDSSGEDSQGVSHTLYTTPLSQRAPSSTRLSKVVSGSYCWYTNSCIW